MDSFFAEGRIEEVEPWLKEKIEEADNENRETVLAALWSELGGFYRGSGRLKESEQAFCNAVKLAEKREETDTPSFGVLLINLAGTLRLAKRFKEALNLYDRAEAIMRNRTQNEDISYQIASLYNNRSLVYQEMEHLEDAKAALLKALEIIDGKPECREEAAITYTNLALLYGKQNCREEEEKALNQALKLYEGLDQMNNSHYASVLSALGGCFYEQREYEKALNALEQAAGIMYRLFGGNCEYGTIMRNIETVRQQMDKEGKMADEGNGTGKRIL
ncbi:hypothetical protein C0033_18150 [Clostridium sp. chh4-2]|uniref:tetratricopeptide repeat protein n=1 Tax=Clostridium sp. chh4-2 TaxID=2067550 RepID=UPI000CCFC4C0|nr:tetratricopeptide repeat protein [Clostridium sp. chh4-2]PNV60685.1 hypothetical protein C0033_18150 [Clostridium sp. chh4-2]